jgi:hypothetical protein
VTTYSWTMNGFSSCSASCLGGTFTEAHISRHFGRYWSTRWGSTELPLLRCCYIILQGYKNQLSNASETEMESSCLLSSAPSTRVLTHWQGRATTSPVLRGGTCPSSALVPRLVIILPLLLKPEFANLLRHPQKKKKKRRKSFGKKWS